MTSLKASLSAACLLGLIGAAGACVGPRADGEPVDRSEPVDRGEAVVTAMSIEDAQKQLTDSLIILPGWAGTAIGECEGAPCIKVMVVRKPEDLLAKIPSTFEGFPVVVEETGEFRALGQSDPR